MIKPKVLLTSIITSLLLTAFCFSLKSDIKDENELIQINADSVSYTMKEFTDLIKDKREHYPFSDEFIERYQQTSGGYIDYAKECGIVVDKTLHSPNQKWHFFDSWYIRSIEDGSLLETDSAQSRVYSKLQCPELLLWIYEACNTDINKVREAKRVAEEGKIQNLKAVTIAKNMRAVVSWDDMVENIEK